MENTSVIYCGNDIITIADILSVEIISSNKHILETFEEQTNGAKATCRTRRTNNSIVSIDERVLERLAVILNKYWREVSYHLPRPHKEFVPTAKSSFKVIDASYSKYIYNITPEKYDVSICWEYHWHVDDPCGGHLGNSEKVLSLRKDVYPALKKIIGLKPKTAKEKKKETVSALADLGLFFMGISSIRFSDDSVDISDKTKKELESIYKELHEYYSAVDNADKEKREHQARLIKYEEFMDLYEDKKILSVVTTAQPCSYEYLEGLCDFDIYAKKQEIEEKLEEYQCHLRQKIALVKSKYAEQIIAEFDGLQLLSGLSLSNDEKIEEYSAVRDFCLKYLPMLDRRDFYLTSLSEEYPDYISYDACVRFQDNWNNMNRSYNALNRGKAGEEKVNEVLSLFEDRMRILRNFTWGHEHDFIIITPYGISTIEVKMLRGDYILTETGVLKSLSHPQVKSKDVALQSKKHLETLRRNLKGCSAFTANIPLQEIICSAEANFTIKDNYHYIPVCYYNTIDKILLPDDEEILSTKEMNEIYEYLVDHRCSPFKFDVFLPRGEIESRETFIETFADIASGIMAFQNNDSVSE